MSTRHGPSRREIIQRALGAGAGMLALPGLLRGDDALGMLAHTHRRSGPDLDVALAAERWIRASRIRTSDGVVWPADPRDPATVTRSLYTGTPGVILFLLELHHTTGERAFLDEARAGASDLMANPAGSQFDGGLYTGEAGRGFTLAEVGRATGDDRFRHGARQALARLRQNARTTASSNGVEWSDSTDIISGGAGIALFLLYAAKALGEDDAVELASRAAKRLIELGRPEHGGLKWAISPRVANLYPNFSHGAAGVAYALASVYAVTRESALLDAALAGARYLDAVADRTDDACRVFHHEPGGTDLFYLSWCHGGAGTARLFYRLEQVTGEAHWLDRIHCYARGITAMGAPVQRSPGYWNNISQCCGNAGVGEFFLSLHGLWPERRYLAVARSAADDVRARATTDERGLHWVQAEHRVRPELLVAQTGFMQGAAGAGTFFLRLDAQAAGRTARIVLPDSPFG